MSDRCLEHHLYPMCEWLASMEYACPQKVPVKACAMVHDNQCFIMGKDSITYYYDSRANDTFQQSL